MSESVVSGFLVRIAQYAIGFGRLFKTFFRSMITRVFIRMVSNCNKEGEYRWFESNVRILYDPKRNSAREIQCASRDITDRIMDKKARLRGQQLAHVFRLSTMEEMASGMAHEISQPLAAIVNYTRGCVRHLDNSKYDADQLKNVMEKATLFRQCLGF